MDLTGAQNTNYLEIKKYWHENESLKIYIELSDYKFFVLHFGHIFFLLLGQIYIHTVWS